MQLELSCARQETWKRCKEREASQVLKVYAFERHGETSQNTQEEVRKREQDLLSEGMGSQGNGLPLGTLMGR